MKLQRVVAKHSLPPLPTTNKQIKTLCNKAYETNYLANPRIQPNLKLLKPEPTIARYLLVDPRPIVSTRSRIRLMWTSPLLTYTEINSKLFLPVVYADLPSVTLPTSFSIAQDFPVPVTNAHRTYKLYRNQKYLP